MERRFVKRRLRPHFCPWGKMGNGRWGRLDWTIRPTSALSTFLRGGFALWTLVVSVGMQGDCLSTAPHSLLFRDRMKRGRRNCTNYQPGVDRPASRNHPSKQPFSSETLWRMAGIPKLVAMYLIDAFKSSFVYCRHNRKPIKDFLLIYATIYLKIQTRTASMD